MGRAILILVSGLVILAGMIQMTNNSRAALAPEKTSEEFYEAQAKNVSASLIDNAIRHLIKDNEWDQEVSTDQHYSGKGTLKTYTMGDTTIPGLVWDQWKTLLVSTATYGSHTVKSEVLLRRDSFSRYSYFTDAEISSAGTEIWWYDDDQVTGPVHTNGTFRMSGSPTFNGLITSPNDWYGYTGDRRSSDSEERHGSDSPNFNGGSNFNFGSEIDLPSESQINELQTLAETRGLSFDGDKDLEFFVKNDEGYVKTYQTETEYYRCGWRDRYWCTREVVTGETEYRLASYNGLVTVDGTARVKGTVKGQVTLHSTDQIDIMGDIVYSEDPRTVETSTDLLGLVSEGNIEVDDDAHRDNGSSDLNIHASLMALGSSFKVENYGSGSPRGELNILGGVIQENRGAVGTFSSYGTASGYSKNYVYDQRLLSSVPPEFPRQSKFNIVYWKDELVASNEQENLN